jgi:hypothetical protein
MDGAQVIDRSTLSVGDAYLLDERRAYVAARRRKFRGRGECINQNDKGTHASPIDGGVRCEACRKVHG